MVGTRHRTRLMAFTAEWTIPGDPVCCCPPASCCPYPYDLYFVGVIVDSDLPDPVFYNTGFDVLTMTKVAGIPRYEGGPPGGMWYIRGSDDLGVWEIGGIDEDGHDDAPSSYNLCLLLESFAGTLYVHDDWSDVYTVHVTSGWGSDFEVTRISFCSWYGENTYVNEFGELVTYGVRVVIGPLGDPFDPSGYYGFYHTIEDPSSPSPIAGSYVKQAPQSSPVGQYSSESWESGGPPVFDGFSIS